MCDRHLAEGGNMSTTQPIKDKIALEAVKDYYLTKSYNPRNHLLIILGINTAYRISDMLRLTWGHVYDFDRNVFRSHIHLTEKKTGKDSLVLINDTLRTSLKEYADYLDISTLNSSSVIFVSRKADNRPISRTQAFRIVKEAADSAGLSEENISCHSLRKTFGYFAWKQGTPPALLMNIYRHSSYEITKKYLCIGQDEQDEVYSTISL